MGTIYPLKRVFKEIVPHHSLGLGSTPQNGFSFIQWGKDEKNRSFEQVWALKMGVSLSPVSNPFPWNIEKQNFKKGNRSWEKVNKKTPKRPQFKVFPPQVKPKNQATKPPTHICPQKWFFLIKSTLPPSPILTCSFFENRKNPQEEKETKGVKIYDPLKVKPEKFTYFKEKKKCLNPFPPRVK